MGVDTAEQLEMVLSQLEQYSLVCIKRLPAQPELFCQAVLGRLSKPLLVQNLASIEQVQQQLAAVLCCDCTAEAILRQTQQLTSPLPVVLYPTESVDLIALEYLVQLGAISDRGYCHLPLLMLDTPALQLVLETREGATIQKRCAVVLSMQAPAHRWVVTACVTGLFVAGACLGYLVGWSGWQPQPLENRAVLEPVVAEGISAPETLQAAESTAPVSAESDSLPLINQQDSLDIEQLIEGWRQAWQAQDWDKYAASYVTFYVPLNDDMTHDEWVRWRRARIEKPEWIKIAVDDLVLEPLDHYQVRVTFIQHYQAAGYQDRTRKELYLVRMREGWRINAEQSLR